MREGSRLGADGLKAGRMGRPWASERPKSQDTWWRRTEGGGQGATRENQIAETSMEPEGTASAGGEERSRQGAESGGGGDVAGDGPCRTRRPPGRRKQGGERAEAHRIYFFFIVVLRVCGGCVFFIFFLFEALCNVFFSFVQIPRVL